jgi:phospholipase A1/A2
MNEFNHIALALVLVAGCLPTTTRAQTNAPECEAISEPVTRLSCYDLRHHRGSTAPVTDAASQLSIKPASDYSLLSARWDLDGRRGNLFAPRPYNPVYLLPVTWTDHVNRLPSSPAPDHSVPAAANLNSVEAKFQLSLKAKFAHELFGLPVSLWGGYTQTAAVQFYNGANSRPFRESNYEPEVMLVTPLDMQVLGWKLRLASLSLNHQSNGSALPLSRGWNRVIGGLSLERDDWLAEMRHWVRLSDGVSDDDNPDIEDHVGRFELRLARYWAEHAVSVQLRHSLRGGGRSRGSAQIDYVFPLVGALHGQLQIFSGYGESLIDYNLRQTRFGLGVTIAGWR